MALDFFVDTPRKGSRIVLLVSDGAARIDEQTRDRLRQTFQETGTTLTQYLRKIRLGRAAELLRSGKYNVTEAAMSVGYNSLSHFSKAFSEMFGCCPCATRS